MSLRTIPKYMGHLFKPVGKFQTTSLKDYVNSKITRGRTTVLKENGHNLNFECKLAQASLTVSKQRSVLRRASEVYVSVTQ